MPPSDGKLSIFDTENLDENSIWRVGQNVAIDRTLRARADIMTSVVEAQGLSLLKDEPPPRHRNLVGWPPSTQKEDQKLIAMELASAASLRLP